MIKTDSDRLLKSLVISIVFHAFMFGGMNLLDWFPGLDIHKRLPPVTVRLEKTSPASSVSSVEETIESLPEKIPEQDDPLKETGSSVRPSSTVTEKPIPSAAPYDAYASLEISDNSPIPFASPFQQDSDIPESDYSPKENLVEFEDNEEPMDNREKDFSESVSNAGVSSLISEEDFTNVKAALANSLEQNITDSIDKTEADNSFSVYNNEIVDFDDGFVVRELVVNPPPEMPDDLPSDFPPEIEYKIRFSLNPDGLVKVLSIDPSSVYPRIDASIRKALRSWSFNRSTGSEVVKGTITIIFKAK